MNDGIRPTTNGNDNHKSANIRQAVLALVKRRLLVPLTKWGDCADARVESEPLEIYACATERSALNSKVRALLKLCRRRCSWGCSAPKAQTAVVDELYLANPGFDAQLLRTPLAC